MVMRDGGVGVSIIVFVYQKHKVKCCTLVQIFRSKKICYIYCRPAVVIGYWLLVIGYWLLVIGYWLLVIGYWLLVIGYWLLVIGF